jgi:uncharacterized membrane protein YjgN (DUF898 family)
MVLLSIFNFVMRILTLGIYHFWGKTEERRRIWSGIRMEGEPLQYHGRGMELFLGMLMVVGVVFLPIALLTAAAMFVFGPASPAAQVIPLLTYVLFFFLIGAGIYRAQRYRLSRTSWRGIRGGLDGDGWDYAWTYFWTTMLIPFTLGWIMPWRTVKLQSMISNRMRFGDRSFSFSATPGHLYKRFLVVWLSAIVLFLAAFGGYNAYMFGKHGAEVLASGYQPTPTEIAIMFAVFAFAYLIYLIMSAWYRAQTFNYFAANTTYEGVQFKGTMRAPSLAWISATNYLMVLLTLGLLAPVAQMRSARYMVQNVKFTGPVDFDPIAQAAADEARLGEGMAQAFDVDAF